MSDIVDLNRIRFGVNYTPSQEWWYCWNSFDPSSIARDLDAIAGLGADHLRVFLIWPSFQPNASWVSPAHLDRLAAFMQLAQERNLDVCVTVLNGFLTGMRFIPPFDRREPFYTSEAMFEAQRLFIERVAEVVTAFPNFLCFDLANEINCCWSAADTRDGDAWMDRLLTIAEQVAPRRPHVNGVDHQPWFMPATFSPHALATRQPIVALHCWIYFTGAMQRGGPLDPSCIQLAAAMAGLARAYAGDPHKPIWLQEYGASQEWMAPDVVPLFLERATTAAVDAGVSWFTWWSSHDIHPRFAVDQLEYTLGLLTSDNRRKPQADAFHRIATAFSTQPRRPTPPTHHGLIPPPLHNTDATWHWLMAHINGPCQPSRP